PRHALALVSVLETPSAGLSVTIHSNLAKSAARRAVNPRNFFTELKRRNVYKIAIGYGVVAWLLLQAASILFPTFEAPPWTMKVFVAVTALGFPIALIIAWAFELTPEGLKRTELADELPKKSPGNRAGTKGRARSRRQRAALRESCPGKRPVNRCPQ